MTSTDKIVAITGLAALGAMVGIFTGSVKKKNEMQYIKIGAIVGAVAGIIFIKFKERDEINKRKALEK